MYIKYLLSIILGLTLITHNTQANEIDTETRALSQAPINRYDQSNALLKVKDELMASKSILEELKDNNVSTVPNNREKWSTANKAVLRNCLFITLGSAATYLAINNPEAIKMTLFCLGLITISAAVTYALIEPIFNQEKTQNEDQDNIENLLKVINEALALVDQQLATTT